MKPNRTGRAVALATALTLAVTASFGAPATFYRQVNLVANQPGVARTTDPLILNSWGIVSSPGGRFVVVNNHSGTVTFHNPNGHRDSPIIHVPSPAGEPGAPTDLAVNPWNGFRLYNGRHAHPSLLLFVTEDGTIAGWNPHVVKTQAVIVVDNSASDAVYKGVAVARTHRATFLYAANFKGGMVEVYDDNFRPVKTFTDTNVPAGFAPFGIRNIGHRLLVTFAKQLAPDNDDDEAGPGLGYVDVFDFDGNLVRRFASEGPLNAPYGMAWAPRGFGPFSGALLIGNFGDGRINAFDPATGDFLGQLSDADNNPVTIEGLWGLDFNNPFFASRLYFAAGPNDEEDGVVGFVEPARGHR